MAVLAVNPRRIDLEDLAIPAKRAAGNVEKIIIHWSAGHGDQKWDDYHINIDRDGQIFLTCDSMTEKKEHTWHRNSGTLGIALDCAYGAECRMDWEDENAGAIEALGDEAPTPEQLEMLYQVVTVLVDNLGLEFSYRDVMTHCEAAFEDGYGPGSGDPETRWDLWYIDDHGMLKQGGQLIRDKAAWYSRSWKGEE